MSSGGLWDDASASRLLRAAGEDQPRQNAQLVGTDGADTLSGGAGDDSLSGGAGDDLLSGGGGANFLDGGLGNDTVTYASATEGITASLAANSGRGGADTLFGIEALVGGAFGDNLTGNALDNTITGGAGQDTLAGGAGADLFVFGSGHTSPTAPDVITDWSAEDRMTFFGAGPGPYQETSAPDAGRTHANTLLAAGARYVAVQTPDGVILYADTDGNGAADQAALLSGRTLADISAANVGSIETLPTAPMGPAEPPPSPTTPPPTPPGPTTPPPPPPGPREPPPDAPNLPAAPSAGIGGARGRIHGDMDQAHLTHLLNAVITDASSSFVIARLNDIYLRLDGFGFTSDGAGNLTGGVATAVAYEYGAAHGGPFSFGMAIPQVSLITLATWATYDQTQTFFNVALSGSDSISGSVAGDLLRGLGGNDLIYGGGGGDTVWGGDGADVIFANAPGAPDGFERPTYLRGEAGNDYIVGGVGFDDINGNQGADTASGGLGDDWVVGGKDNDLLFGDAGADLVYGNLGADTCVGGDGNDIVRGGQDNDLVFGGAGDDYVSGDKGDDTVTGGEGADLFHTFGDAGIDRVTDFDADQGDRVLLDPGTQHTVAQVGADTVISMTGGGQMILVGVQLAGLPDGWIFGA